MELAADDVIMKGGVGISRPLLHARCLEVAKCAGEARAWAIVALLFEPAPTSFRWRNAQGLAFEDCATTDHLSRRIGELIAGHGTDRELVRDHRIRPLRALGVLECVIRRGAEVKVGHLVPNSSDNGYRLSAAAARALSGPEDAFADYLAELGAGQHAPAEIEDDARGDEDASDHIAILNQVRDIHVPSFHPGFEIIWMDRDGGSLTAGGRQARMGDLGLSLERGDAIPDMILFNAETREVRFVEAIATGGEPDTIKHAQLLNICRRWGVRYGGTVCAYKTRKHALSRRARMPQEAQLSHAWSVSDPSLIDAAAVRSWPGGASAAL